MSGHVGIIATDAARFTLFGMCLADLKRPVNTRILWQLVNDRAAGRNAIVEHALSEGSEWVLFLDDDQAFAPTLLERLLSHERPIVGALYLQRGRPFHPIAYRRVSRTGNPVGYRLPDMPEDALVKVVACGTGGMLIRAEAFRAIGPPWFENRTGWSEDVVFCEKAGEAGVPVVVDTGCRMGHLSVASLWPNHHDGKWSAGFQVADGFAMAVPIED